MKANIEKISSAVHKYPRLCSSPMLSRCFRVEGGKFLVWCRKAIVVSLSTSTDSCNTAMKTKVVTASSSRPPPGQWQCAQVLADSTRSVVFKVWILTIFLSRLDCRIKTSHRFPIFSGINNSNRKGFFG